jgi:hypothetical protein
VLEPVFEELEHRKSVVYVHPDPSPDAVAHSLGLPESAYLPAEANPWSLTKTRFSRRNQSSLNGS